MLRDEGEEGRNDGGCLEANRNFALAETVVVYFTEKWGKLFCTGLQC